MRGRLWSLGAVHRVCVAPHHIRIGRILIPLRRATCDVQPVTRVYDILITLDRGPESRRAEYERWRNYSIEVGEDEAYPEPCEDVPR